MKTLLDEKMGEATIRIIATTNGFRGNVTRNGKQSETLEDDDFDRLKARLRNEAGRLHPDYIGFDGAIARFRSFFREGFADPAFKAMERAYKLHAQENLLTALPLSEAAEASAEQAASVRKAYYTNLLSQFELARMHAVLVGETGAAFVRGAAKFTAGNYGAGIAAMAQAIKPHGRSSWPMVTYLPNLWQPEKHMFLKPEKTKDFAERVGHPFASEYRADLDPDVYLSLLDLVAETERAIATLKPCDRIDVQSFIWVVGDYGEDEHEAIAAERLKLGSVS